MSRLLQSLFALLLLAACAKERPAQPTKVALWEVSDGMRVRGWLFGTVHALPSGVAWQRPAIESALAASDRLVLEIAEPLSLEAGERVMKRLAFTPGLPPPSQRVAPDARDDMAAAYRRLSLSDGSFRDVESWAVALRIAAAAGQKAGYDPADGVEPALRRLAPAKPVEGLETLAGQLAMFDRLDAREQSVLLGEIAREAAEGENDETALLLDAWLAGDMDAIAREALTGFLADPGVREDLLTARNRAWAERIDADLRAGSRPFVAVGAAHLAGDEGLPRLLEQRGWTVRRVP